MLKKIITIEGMHCSHCAGTVEKAVGEIDGVTAAKVKLEKKVCTVKLASDADDTTLRSAVQNAGFEVTNIETKKQLF